VTLTFDLWP